MPQHYLSGNLRWCGNCGLAAGFVYVRLVDEERDDGKLYCDHRVRNDEASARKASSPENKFRASQAGEAPGAETPEPKIGSGDDDINTRSRRARPAALREYFPIEAGS